jgi:hypothetical protein
MKKESSIQRKVSKNQISAMLVIAAILASSIVVALQTIQPANAAPIVLTIISTPFNNPIGIDHHVPTNKVIMSVNYPSGFPYNLEIVAHNGSRTGFSSVSGLTDELKIATVRDTIGGFAVGEVFTGNGHPGQIVRISADGLTVQNPWVTLAGEPGLMRGSLYVDRTGIFGGDLIVVTTSGNVWRINSSGVATKLASIGVHLEGLSTIPNNATKYGPWAGKILTGAEGQTRFYTISTSGAVAFYNIGVQPEDIDIIPENENFFGVNYGAGRLMGAPASAFDGMEGDLLVAQEFPGYLWHIRWNPATSAFEKTVLATVAQWEHVTFSSAGIVEIPPAPVNNAPVANNQAVSTNEDTPVGIILSATDADGDLLSYTVLTNSSNGVLSGTAPNLTYTPDTDYNGVDSFTFKANDGTDDSNTATVSITVNADNDAPVAYDQNLTTNEDTPLPITLNATDIDGDSLTYTVISGPANGNISGAAPNLTYTPNANYNGADSFVFEVSDGEFTDSATISITVSQVNDAPDVSGAIPSLSMLWPPNHKMVPITIGGIADIEGDSVTITITSVFQDEPTNGLGDGDKSQDASGIGTSTAQVRSERSGSGDGRVYHISFTADDGNGGASVGTVIVIVPLSQDPSSTAIDQGPLYDSTVA